MDDFDDLNDFDFKLVPKSAYKLDMVIKGYECYCGYYAKSKEEIEAHISEGKCDWKEKYKEAHYGKR